LTLAFDNNKDTPTETDICCSELSHFTVTAIRYFGMCGAVPSLRGALVGLPPSNKVPSLQIEI